MMLLYNPVKNILGTYNAIQRSFGAAERVFVILDKVPEIGDAPDAVEIDRAEGNVEFNKVSFSYIEKLVLKEVFFSVRKGEVVAFVGPSGGVNNDDVPYTPFLRRNGRVGIDRWH